MSQKKEQASTSGKIKQANQAKQPVLQEINELVKKLRQYQHEYYVLSRPSVSDAEYDKLFDRLQELEAQYPECKLPDSPTLRVGSDLSQEFPEVNHSIPVLSLDKCYNYTDLTQWITKTENNAGQALSFVLEQKIDGSSIVLYYRQGELERAVTRGNGLVGNDITGNVKTIRAVPLKLSRAVDLAVRGEIFLPKQHFTRINQELEVPYANPRNLAAGVLRRIKSSEVAPIPLDIFAYEGFFFSGGSTFRTHFEVLEELKDLGFKLNPATGFFSDAHELAALRKKYKDWHFGSLKAMDEYIKEQKNGRSHLEYEIDGLVLKINELPVREELGYTGHHPRWAIAFKFESPVGRTIVRNIEVQVGRTGRVTPVARVEPVTIAGSVIANVTLHNQEYINLLELAVGDTVEVSKRGDVIPAVERVLEKNETGARTWQMPARCPVCQIKLVVNGAHTFCPNRDGCEAQLKGRLYFFVARGQMDIENLGPETIDFLYNKGLVKEIEDIYRFNPDELLSERGFGEKKVNLIKAGIEKSKGQPYPVVLAALGIPDLGQKMVELLIDAGYRDIDSLLALIDRNDMDALLQIHGVGEKTARQLFQELGKTEVRLQIRALKEAGLNMAMPSDDGAASYPQVFKGQTWCVTGSFTHFKPREKAMEEVKKRGGKVTSAVSSQTTHLLAGAEAGSKLQKAIALDVKIVSEDQFLKLLEQPN